MALTLDSHSFSPESIPNSDSKSLKLLNRYAPTSQRRSKLHCSVTHRHCVNDVHTPLSRPIQVQQSTASMKTCAAAL